MASLKPNKPERYDGKRDELAVRAWLYQVQQYLNLVQVEKTSVIADSTKISFASTFFTGTAAFWWYTRVDANTDPKTWNDFEAAVVQEFVPKDSTQRARDKVARLAQKTSVSAYLTEFRNVCLSIPGMSEGEKVDRFVRGLKPLVRIEVIKAGAQSMDDASRIALSVDSALFGARMFHNPRSSFAKESFADPTPTPMDIGNIEQRRKDLQNNSCFKCHKVGCRPWKCRTSGKPSISNTEAKPEEKGVGVQSEN